MPGLAAVTNAQHLPFRDATLDAIVMTDVLHHIPTPRAFFAEAARAVRPGGRIIMHEPWITTWSQLIYNGLHHEPLNPHAGWEIPASGPLSGANIALPWILFERDRSQFEDEFPEWHVRSVEVSMPFAYLISGGVSLRELVPGWSYPLVRRLEATLSPWNDSLGMFALIVLERIPGQP